MILSLLIHWHITQINSGKRNSPIIGFKLTPIVGLWEYCIKMSTVCHMYTRCSKGPADI